MQTKIITLISFVFIAAAPAAMAAPAMNDAQLASYISGRLSEGLTDAAPAPQVSCDSNGCAVVVQ